MLLASAHDGDCRKDAPKRTATHFDDHDVIDIIDLGSVLDAESVNLHADARSIDSSHGCGADMQVGLAPPPPGPTPADWDAVVSPRSSVFRNLPASARTA